MNENNKSVNAIINKYKCTVKSKTRFNEYNVPIRYTRCFDKRTLENGEQESLLKEIKDCFGEYDIYAISYIEDWSDKSDEDYDESEPDMMRLIVAYMDRGQIKIVTENVWKSKECDSN